MAAGLLVCVLVMLPLAVVVVIDGRRRQRLADRPRLWMQSSDVERSDQLADAVRREIGETGRQR